LNPELIVFINSSSSLNSNSEINLLELCKEGIKNIDFLNVGNPCPQNCRQCFYQESGAGDIDFAEEVSLISLLSQSYPKASYFLYPPEISNNQDYISLMGQFNQKVALSNGRNISEPLIAKLRTAGIEEIQITLFADAEQQQFFNGNTRQQYQEIKDSIRRCVDNGIKVAVNNVLAKRTINSIGDLCAEISNLGAAKLNFLRLMPKGNALSLDESEFLEKGDMKPIITSIEAMKQKYPDLYLSCRFSFGPNFYGKSLDEARQKIARSNLEWTKKDYLCPAINQRYAGISLKSKRVYWCFGLISNPEISVIGYVNPPNIIVTNPVDLSARTLSEKLRGNCAKDNCALRGAGYLSIGKCFRKAGSREFPGSYKASKRPGGFCY